MKRHFTVFYAGTLLFFVLLVLLVVSSNPFGKMDETTKTTAEENHKEMTVEGSFADNNGKIIFAPQRPYQEDETPMHPAYSYLLGYNDEVYKATGLRAMYSDHLYDDMNTGKGGSIQLTIDKDLQEKAYSFLQEKDLSGSITVLNARNAEILAMVGRREEDFDVTNLDAEKMQKYNRIPGFLLSPATGDYKAPGSVFKILTSAAAYNNNLQDFVYEDTGELVVNGVTLHNATSTPRGRENLQMAFINSTNTYFASLSLKLGDKAMTNIFNDFLVGSKIDLGFTTLDSSATLSTTDLNLAMVGYGQGAVAVSPLHIAMIGQSIINRGRMIQPSIVKAMYNAKGKEVYRNIEHKKLVQTVTPEVAENIKGLMKGLVDAKYAKWSAYTDAIYAKTGTAKQTDNATIYNSYFLCMTEEYVILVSINDTPDFGGDFSYIAERLLSVLY